MISGYRLKREWRNFLGKVLPAHMPSAATAAHVLTPKKRPEIPAVADDKMEATSTAS
jgi:hypothetical protein